MATQSLRPPLRPEKPGTLGQKIRLHANHFVVDKLPEDDIHHYDVSIKPDRTPRKLNKGIVNALLMSGDQRLGNQKPVYDGAANMYCRRPFPFDKEKTVFEITVQEPGSTVEKRFQVTLKWAARVSMSVLKTFLANTGRQERQQQAMLSMDDVQSSIQALDVILRYGPASRYVAVGRSFFSPPSSHILDLGGGMAVWRGFHMSMRPSMWGMHLNVDVSITAFYKGLPIIDFLKEVVKDRNLRCQVESGRWQDRDRLIFKRELKGLKIEVRHSGNKRTHRVIDLSPQSAENILFAITVGEEQKQMSVVDYLDMQYNLKLQYPHLPCLQVGVKEKRTFFPMELCTVASGQRVTKKLPDKANAEMIRGTAQPAPERKRTIAEKFHEAELNSSEALREFGISVSDRMLNVEGRVLHAPKMQHTGAPIAPRNGAWDARGRKLHKSASLATWVLLNFDDRVYPKSLQNFFKMLAECGQEDGFRLNPVPAKFNERPVKRDDIEGLLYSWHEMSVQAKSPIEMVFLVLPGRTTIYGEFKRICDTKMGIPSQCLQGKNVNRPNPQICHNILLKMNAKLGGVNFIIEPSFKHAYFTKPIIVMGADVTHPGIGNSSSPSVAAVVGSLDAYPMLYAAQVSVQKHRQEVIADLKSMTRACLLEFYKKTNHQPLRILFYRDGVSEGQFQTCLNEEMRSIREACTSLAVDYKPGITFITVQKRHHTRFFCADRESEQGKARNIPAGTVVDTGVVHPTDNDFFLNSHFGIQGTSRPSHYYVLWDDNKFSQDELHGITYQLCHTYVRCTRSVSIPAPAYYAHLVAFRARNHIEGFEPTDSDSGSIASGGRRGPPAARASDLKRAITIKDSFIRSMYFA